MISICAVICARNEAPYLKVLLPRLASQGIEVALIDNGSTDGSLDLYREYSNAPIVILEHMPYPGYYSQTQQLQAKQRVYQRLKHDWVVHHDADEVFENPDPGLSLRDAILEADAGGYGVLNLDEFVFLPEPGQEFSGKDYYSGILRYYFFEPAPNRLNRVWRRDLFPENLMSGGHTLTGSDLSIFPINQVMRHYIVLGYEHALSKYLGRKFAPEDLAKGWHGNRLKFTEENLRLPESSPFLFTMEDPASRPFHTERPTKKHFWEWTE